MYNNKAVKLPDKNKLEKLIENYFNATATREEIQILIEAAHLIDNNRINFTPSPGMKEDLAAILSIEEWGKASLAAMEESTPADLETRLERQISELAKRDRRSLRLRLFAVISSAAAVLLLITFGSSVSNYIFDSSDKGKENPPVLAENSVKTPDATDSTNIAPVISRPELNSLANMKEKSPEGALLASNKPTEHRSIGIKKEIQSSAAGLQVSGNKIEDDANQIIAPPTTASVEIPESLSPIEEILPRIATATVDPAQLVVQPFTTLNQVFDNVYESVSMVGVALSGVNDTFNAASNELNKIGNSQLRPI